MPANLTFLYFYPDLDTDELYMRRCIQLAQLGCGYVAPNPMVGAVLVHDNRIIGEGYHKKYGEAHAEVNCITSVAEVDRFLIPASTMYVSLEPCNHYGKTPPCTELLVRNKVQRVIIGCPDPFLQASSPLKGVDQLKSSGIKVITGILEQECIHLNRRFFTFHQQHRPYIILKWAQTLDGRIANASHLKRSGNDGNGNGHRVARLRITNEMTNRVVHKWRSEEMGIMVGTRTAFADDPELSTRLWQGQNPIRIVIDKKLELPRSLKLFDAKQPTIVFNTRQHNLPEKISVEELKKPGVWFYQVTDDVSMVHQVVNALYQLQIQSVMIEGGSYLLQSFIDEGMWDEARVITNENLVMDNDHGLPAPMLKGHRLGHVEPIWTDVVRNYLRNKEQPA